MPSIGEKWVLERWSLIAIYSDEKSGFWKDGVSLPLIGEKWVLERWSLIAIDSDEKSRFWKDGVSLPLIVRRKVGSGKMESHCR